MADSIEQKLMDAIKARMQLINGTGLYLTSIGTRVEDSRPNWDESELPAISIFEGTVTTEESDDEGINVIRKMPVMIKGFLDRLDTAALDAAFARKAIADIYRAIRSDDKRVVSGTPAATFTSERQHGIEYAENTFEITGVQVEIDIEYRAAKFNMES